ncbi:hypothetical protein BB558_002274, partial [Smittium angustum]
MTKNINQNQVDSIVSSLWDAVNGSPNHSSKFSDADLNSLSILANSQNFTSDNRRVSFANDNMNSTAYLSPVSDYSPADSSLQTPFNNDLESFASMPTYSNNLYTNSLTPPVDQYSKFGEILLASSLSQLESFNNISASDSSPVSLVDNLDQTLKSQSAETLLFGRNPSDTSLKSSISSYDLPIFTNIQSSRIPQSSPNVGMYPDSEEFRKRCDKQFLESLPPQLALKRKRTRSSKHLDAIDKLVQSTETEEYNNEIDENCDSQNATKRNKNTDAARRSRLRKALRMDSLEKQVVQLEQDNKLLKESIKAYESEKSKYSEREELLRDHIRSMNMLLMSAMGNKYPAINSHIQPQQTNVFSTMPDSKGSINSSKLLDTGPEKNPEENGQKLNVLEIKQEKTDKEATVTATASNKNNVSGSSGAGSTLDIPSSTASVTENTLFLPQRLDFIGLAN